LSKGERKSFFNWLLRNVLIHEDFGVRLETEWAAVDTRLQQWHAAGARGCTPGSGVPPLWG